MFKNVLNYLFVCISMLALIGCELELGSEADSEPEPTYEISGTVNSLDGEIELSLNNEEFLTVSGSGSVDFKFENKLNSGTSYSIEITSQPAGQRCRISNGDGSVKEQNVYYPYVSCNNFYRGLSGVTEVKVGSSHSCGIIEGGVECWGHNSFGEISVPVNLKNPRLIAAGGSHSCVLDDTGIVCWGMENSTRAMIEPPQNLTNVKELAAGSAVTCAIDDIGLRCWGESEVLTNYPTGLTDPHDLVVKTSNACVIDGKKPVCWGYNEEAITLPEDLLEVEDIDIGQTHGCAISVGEVICWGDNWGFEDGNGPIDVPGDIGVVTGIELGSATSCAITDVGIQCWGSSAFGTNDIQYIASNPSVISIERFHGCAIESDELICFGSNSHGESEIPDRLY